jgi:gliding motility-associated-like protein
MNKLKIENIVKDKLNDFEYKSSKSDWDNFEKKLPKKKINLSKYIIAASTLIIGAIIFNITFNKTEVELNKNEIKNIVKNKIEYPNNIDNKELVVDNTKTPKESRKIIVKNNSNEKTIIETKDDKNNIIGKIKENIIQNPIITIDTSESIDKAKTKTPLSDFSVNIKEGCAPLTVKFQPKEINSNVEFYWEFGDSNFSKERNPEHIFTKPGNYNIKLTSRNTLNKKGSSYNMNIVVYDNPKADFDFTIYENTYSFNSIECEKQIWKFGDNSFSNEINPEHIYNIIGETVVSHTTINKHNCKSEKLKTIIIEPIFQIANAFSPNNDGNNDKFGPVFEYPEKYNYILYIYDVYGNLTYKSRTFNDNWNGKILNTDNYTEKGVYLWKLIINDKFKNKIEKKGKLTIK